MQHAGKGNSLDLWPCFFLNVTRNSIDEKMYFDNSFNWKQSSFNWRPVVQLYTYIVIILHNFFWTDMALNIKPSQVILIENQQSNCFIAQVLVKILILESSKASTNSIFLHITCLTLDLNNFNVCAYAQINMCMYYNDHLLLPFYVAPAHLIMFIVTMETIQQDSLASIVMVHHNKNMYKAGTIGL
ncbi:hypothetical protein ACJX0J_039646 [Zea mays]